ncbi:MAG: hypothetical protein JHC41_09690 [Nitrosopumilus sp.]|nr:hypothetical protein [Nitrosopumilus sp.]
MSYSIFGQVVGVRKFAYGDIEIDFFHEDKITEYKYSPNSSILNNFPKELAETLASTLASDICIEIHFDENGSPTYVELEECDYDEFDDDKN